MRKQSLTIYELIVITLGIGLPLTHVLSLRPTFPAFPDYMIFVLTTILCELVYIQIKNTILSFEVVIYFFVLIMFGGPVAALTAVITLLVVWTLKSIKYITRRNTREFWTTIRMGLYNAGVYGFMYLLTGLLMTYYPANARWILAILTLVVLNELFISARTLLKGDPYWTYIKEEAAISNLMELLIYPIGISMAYLYTDHGIVATIPLIMSISVFSYIGHMMSSYQEKMRQRITEEEDLNEIARKLEGILDFEQLITTTLMKVHSFIHADEVTIILEDPEQGINVMRNYDGTRIRNLKFTIPPKTSSAVELPLVTREKTIGTMIVKPRNPLDKETLVLLTNLGKHISLCLSNAMLYKISIEDALTGLHTRRYFEHKLAESINDVHRNDSRLSIVLFDIDGLKNVNDQLGHKMGDQVLKTFAQILKMHSRKMDVIARWGGDEFVAIIPGAPENEARLFGERMKERFSNEVFIAENKNMKCNVAYGSLEYSQRASIPPSEIFHEVDKRLLSMKKNLGR